MLLAWVFGVFRCEGWQESAVWVLDGVWRGMAVLGLESSTSTLEYFWNVNQITPEPPNCIKPWHILLFFDLNEGWRLGKTGRREHWLSCSSCHHCAGAWIISQNCCSAAPPPHPTPLPSAWDHGKLQKKRPNLSILSSFQEFQKLQLTFTNSGGFWLVCVSWNPNFWWLNKSLRWDFEVLCHWQWSLLLVLFCFRPVMLLDEELILWRPMWGQIRGLGTSQ